MGFVSSVVGFILCIFILVLIHEFGHFWVARRCGVRVLEFAIGFGKPLFSFSKGHTNYSIRSLPLGGFVKMYGEVKEDVPEEFRNEAFSYKNLWQKSAIVVAGPLFNFILAIILFTFLNFFPKDEVLAQINYIKPDSYAQRLGFEVDSKLLSIDGREQRYWMDNHNYLIKQALKNDTAVFEIENIDTLESKNITVDFKVLQWQPESEDIFSSLGIFLFAPLKPILDKVIENKPAFYAGLQSGDEVVAVDNQNITSWEEFVPIIQNSAGKVVEISLMRDNQLISVSLIPEKTVVNDQEIGLIGVSPKIPELNTIELHNTPVSAISNAFVQTYDLTVMSVIGIGKMIVGEMSIKNISGPVTIADYAGKSIRSGVSSFVLFVAFISISLAVINLMPVPVLDGGHLIMYAIEGITGKGLSDNALQIWQTCGIALLLMLMSVAFYNDITRLIQ